jgi:hypothetical protein
LSSASHSHRATPWTSAAASAANENTRNNWLFALATNGDRCHNNHHPQPRCCAHDVQHWWELDVTYQDIGPLAREMVSRFSVHFGKEVPELRGDTLRLLEAYPWPGNIRQLEHSALHAVLPAGRQLLPAHFQAALTGHGNAASRSRRQRPESLTQSNADAERECILHTLRRHGFCRKRTARTLGISRQALYVKMKKHGLSSNPPGADGRLHVVSAGSTLHTIGATSLL